MELFAGLVDLLPWILRIIAILFILRLIRNFFAPASPTRPAGAARPTGRRGGPLERQGGQLVRDPQCGTYVPISASVHLVSGSNTLYFCSVGCRDAYRKAQSSVA